MLTLICIRVTIAVSTLLAGSSMMLDPIPVSFVFVVLNKVCWFLYYYTITIHTMVDNSKYISENGDKINNILNGLL